MLAGDSGKGRIIALRRLISKEEVECYRDANTQ
jgi:hypothetical protein